MEVSEEEATLLVRHLPGVLSISEREDLLKHFGATSVQCMPDKGKLRYAAFARFPDAQSAKDALKRLHQLDVLGSTLVVEISKQAQHKKYHPSHLKEPGVKSEEEGKTTHDDGPDLEKAAAETVNALSSRLGVTYPLNPKLHYAYPLPNVTTLTNIANALASVPKFYVQVLHLMNKMNLPPPFGVVTPTPPLPEGRMQSSLSDINKRDQGTNTHEQDFLEMDSDESEIMSEDEGPQLPVENVPVKRIVRQSEKKRKKPKLSQLIHAPATAPKSTPAPVPEEVFEVASSSVNVSGKTIEFKLAAEKVGEAAHQQTEAKEVRPVQPPLPPGPPPEVGAFGKLEPVARTVTDEQEELEEEEFGDGEFISSSQLRKGRLSSSQLKDFSVFKNYSPGEPSSRLYIKNLAKQTTEKDLHFVFGRYVDWSNEQEKLMFDIRLMKEGRMKGQAFITLPGADVAKKALKDTNGYVFNTKPMVVQFARSAKPKDEQSKS